MKLAKGDLIRVDFHPAKGHEQIKRRYAVVVSNGYFNSMCNLAFICPVTSVDNGYPLHVDIGKPVVLDGSETQVSGFAEVEQIKSLDIDARDARYVGRVSPQVSRRITEMALSCLM